MSISLTTLPITAVGATCTDSVVGIGLPSTEIIGPPTDTPGSSSDSITSGIYKYKVSNGEAIITDCDTSATGAINIPSTLDEYPVTGIGSYAFQYCNNLTGVTIPNGVTEIGSYAFEYCTALTNVTIGKNVTTIGYSAFYNCISLISITVSENSNYYCSDNGILFNKNKTLLICYPVGKTATSYVIPNSVTVIGADAFYKCTNLTGISIPNSVTEIESCAFSGCSNLTSITLPNSLIEIGWGAFSSCDGLTSVEIPNNVIKIDTHAFSGCDSLTSVTIPDSVTEIDSTSFNNSCPNLKSITVSKNNNYYCSVDGVLFNKSKTILICYPDGRKDTSYIIPDGVIEVDRYAFNHCKNLTSITIPDSLVKIGEYAFSDCNNLTNVSIPDSVTEIGFSTFSYCTSLKNVVIPDSVSEIEGYVFNFCTSLTSITFSENVARIDLGAFLNCDGLTDIYYKGTESEWENIYFIKYNESLTNATKHFVKHTRTTILDEGKTFSVNPINVETGKKVILALYEKGKLVEMQHATYEGVAIPFAATKSYNEAKVMVWDDLTNLKPVCVPEVVK